MKTLVAMIVGAGMLGLSPLAMAQPTTTPGTGTNTTTSVQGHHHHGKGGQCKQEMEQFHQLDEQLKAAHKSKDHAQVEQIAQKMLALYKQLPAEAKERIKEKHPKLLERLHHLAAGGKGEHHGQGKGESNASGGNANPLTT